MKKRCGSCKLFHEHTCPEDVAEWAEACETYEGVSLIERLINRFNK